MRKASWAIVAVCAAALTLGIVALAGGFSGAENEGGEATVTGATAVKAKAAAVHFLGGGQATEVKRESDEGAAYGVEVRKNDGSQVEVYLDRTLKPLGTDQQGGNDDEGDDGGG